MERHLILRKQVREAMVLRYSYQCRKCPYAHDMSRSYKSRNRLSICPHCGGTADKLPASPNLHLFKPFNFDISPMKSVEVDTKGQLKRLCKEHGKYAPGYDILEHSKET